MKNLVKIVEIKIREVRCLGNKRKNKSGKRKEKIRSEISIVAHLNGKRAPFKIKEIGYPFPFSVKHRKFVGLTFSPYLNPQFQVP